MEFWADYQYILAGRGRTKCGSLAHLVNPQADGGGSSPGDINFVSFLARVNLIFGAASFPPRFSSTCSVSPFCFKVGAARREIDIYTRSFLTLPFRHSRIFMPRINENRILTRIEQRNKRIKESWLKNYQRELNENWWITIEILFTKYTYNENLYL